MKRSRESPAEEAGHGGGADAGQAGDVRAPTSRRAEMADIARR